MRTVIVDGQSAAEIEGDGASPFPDQADEDPAGLTDGGADLPDIGDLRAEMIVHHLQAVEHALGRQQVDRLDHLVWCPGRKSNGLRPIRPSGRWPGGELDR